MKRHMVSDFIGPVNMALTWLALFSGEVIRHGRFALLFLSLWFCLALSPLPEILSSLLLALLSYGLIAGFVYAGIIFTRKITLPALPDVLKQIEDRNDLENRPLRSLSDSLPEPLKAQVDTKQLWQHHQEQLFSDLPKLSPGWINPVLVEKDPFALRFLCLFLLLIFATINDKPLKQIFTDSLYPVALFPPALPLQVDGWITPPDYTRMATTLLESSRIGGTGGQSDVVIFPAQSELVLQVNNSAIPPQLYIENKVVADTFEQQATNSFRLATKVNQGGGAELRVDGEIIAEWNFRLIPDLPPEIRFDGQISQTSRKSLRIPFMAVDDYGIKRIDLRLTRNKGEEEEGTEEILQLPLLEGDGLKRDFTTSHFLDLTAHPWAGLQTRADLLVFDALDQIGSSLSQIVTLPQRLFTDPVARQIIAIRRTVAAAVSDEDLTWEALRTAMLAEKSDAYEHDPAVYMMLHIIARRLDARDKIAQKQNSMRLLWDTALYLEEGEAIANLGKLQAAEKELMDAINHGADKEEVNRLMQALEQTMAEYMQALAKELQTNDRPRTNLQRQLDASRMMDSKSIQDMMEQLRRLLEMGMMDAARDVLAEIQNIMENLQMAAEEDLPDSSMEAVEMLHDIEEVIKKQQRLMERSYNRAMGRDSDSGQTGNNNGAAMSENMPNRNSDDIAAQAALAEQLKQMREDYKSLMQQDTPQSFSDSENAMRGAGRSLERGNDHLASDLQGKAIETLQQALRQMEDNIIERFMQTNQQSISAETSPTGKGIDPFGRHTPNGLGNNDDGTRIPDASQMGRARSIQQELRRRFNEGSRSEEERNYIQRLLQSFP